MTQLSQSPIAYSPLVNVDLCEGEKSEQIDHFTKRRRDELDDRIAAENKVEKAEEKHSKRQSRSFRPNTTNFQRKRIKQSPR
jgi:hypothetical protein